MWPFAKKEECFGCRKRVDVATMRPRRGLRFCSPACVDAYVNENPFPRPHGDDTQLASELVNLIIAIGGEVQRIHAAAGRRGDEGAREESIDAAGRFVSLATETLAYLSGLGLAAAFERVDTIDFEAVIDAAGHHPVVADVWQALVSVKRQLAP